MMQMLKNPVDADEAMDKEKHDILSVSLDFS